MTRSHETAARIIARAFPEADSSRLDAIRRLYDMNRKARRMGASEALERALGYVWTDTGRPSLWYGPRGGYGAPFESGRDVLRWTESTADAGLRFIGWADELPGGPDHTGWYTDDAGEWMTLRGGVWQLPGRNGRARFVYGYAEWEGRGEMNPGSAAICVSDIVESEPCRAWESVSDLPELRDAARWADSLAEHAAEKERDYRRSYDAGREAAEHDSAAIAARRELLPLLADLRDLRKAGAGDDRPAVCKALRARVDSLLETISEERDARDSAWSSVYSSDRESWAAGFMDESEGGFVRAVRLGYASRDDWRGAPEACPV